MAPFHYKEGSIEFIIPVTKETLVGLALIMRETVNKNGKKEWVLQMLNEYHRLNKHSKNVTDKTEYNIDQVEFLRQNPARASEEDDLTFVGKPRVLSKKQQDEYLATIPNIW